MWRERGLTMVLVTHDSTVARRAQRIGVMKNGRLTFKQPARSKAARTQPAAAQAQATAYAAPLDAAPLDAEPLDAEPLDAEPLDNDLLDTGASGLQPSDLPTADSLSFPDSWG
jgi:ABC-type multidrug transport system ATPase subunit